LAILERDRQTNERRQVQSVVREQQLRTHNAALMELSRSTALERGEATEAFRQITRIAAQTLEVERASVWLYSDDHTKILCLDLYERSADRHGSGLELAAADYPAYFLALNENRAIAAEDAFADPRTREFGESYLKPLRISSMLDAPVRLGGHLIGLICHEHVGPIRQWTPEEQAFAGSMADFVALTLQASDRRRAQEAVRESEQRLRQIIDLVPHMIFVKDRTHRFLLANRAVAEAYGTTVDGLIGRHHRSVHRAELEVDSMLADDLAVLEGGQPKFIPEETFTDVHGTTRVLQTTKIPLAQSGAAGPAVLGVSIDITELKHAHDRQEQMIQELDHRVKNTLAKVLAIAEQTIAGSGSLEEFSPAFAGRIRAIAVAHEMLAQTRWEGAELREAVMRIVEPYRRGAPDRFSISGPQLVLPTALAPAVCMILHELVTNAAKHGALSVPSGRVTIEWSTPAMGPGARQARLRWIERGGPPVTASDRRGFGIEFIERMTAHQLHGQARIAFETAGLTCELSFAIERAATLETREPGAPEPGPCREAPPVPAEAALQGLRVLLVEDDYLVAQSLASQLRSMGCEVIGPAATERESCELVRRSHPQAAILDINLSRGTSAPIARALQMRGCPFMFVTGYSNLRMLPDDLRGYRILAKPVDRETLCSAMHEMARLAA
jgi:PAS domain S-box-containing protein